MVEDIRAELVITIKNVLRTDKIEDFRICIDEKDNMIPATRHKLCPPTTKKMVDVVVKPVKSHIK